MKIKEVPRTANIAWSPAQQHPIYLAAGTAAQQLDASFSTSASLELFELDLSDASVDLPRKGGVISEQRFHRVVWTWHTNSDMPMGYIVAGADNGSLFLYNPVAILEGRGEEAMVLQVSKHSGPVHALDFNPFQRNLVASGASESEIFIWDLNNTNSPMSPGSKTQPFDDVNCVSWNRQVQHILASTVAGKCVVWDLRKSDPIIKVNDSTSRMRARQVVWHPEVATQMCLASEDDHSPGVQLWDLRFATSPIRVLEGHTRGVLAIAWCPSDPDLLLSCAKDGRLLCWNPNTEKGELVYEFPTLNQWCFDVQWCLRDPAVIAGATFDGTVNMYSLLGGPAQWSQPSAKITDSFGQMGNMSEPPQSPKMLPTVEPLRKAPKWLRRPVGASFGFGGRLVTFESSSVVHLSQLSGDGSLLEDAGRLETAVAAGHIADYCTQKQKQATEDDSQVWAFLQGNFEKEPRKHFLQLLSFDSSELAKKIDAMELPEDGSDQEDEEPLTLGDQVPLTEALLTGDFETAVKLCLAEQRIAEAFIAAAAGGPSLFLRVQQYFLASDRSPLMRLLATVIGRKWKNLVDKCQLSEWKQTMAALLTYSTTEELPSLCRRLGERLETAGEKHSAALCFICAGDVNRLAACFPPSASPQALLALVEKVQALRGAVRLVRGSEAELGGPLAKQVAHLAEWLAEQGHLREALRLAHETGLSELSDRLYHALGGMPGMAAPQFPFPRINVVSRRTTVSPRVAPSVPTALYAPQPQPHSQPHPQLHSQPHPQPHPQSHLPAMFPNASAPGLPMAPLRQPEPFVAPNAPVYQPRGGPLSYGGSKSGGAWNDPPAANRTRTRSTPMNTPLEPLMQPLAGLADAVPDASMHPHQPYIPYNPMEFRQPGAVQPTNLQPQPQHQHIQREEPPKPKQRGPLPEEHQSLQHVFDNLADKCVQATNNQQTRKKLDDVRKKLDILYDKLADRTLSDNVILGLHQMIQAIQQYDYQTGLGIHAHMIATGNFSEISPFMPGIKTLLQTCIQMNVYYQM